MRCFREMPFVNFTPDATTYDAVVSACMEGRQWAAALRVFEKMRQVKVIGMPPTYRMAMVACMKLRKGNVPVHVCVDGGVIRSHVMELC